MIFVGHFQVRIFYDLMTIFKKKNVPEWKLFLISSCMQLLPQSMILSMSTQVELNSPSQQSAEAQEQKALDFL